MLRLPKAEMKAFLKGLYAKTISSDRQMAGHIETGFMLLSKFQAGVGSPVESPKLEGMSEDARANDLKLQNNWLLWNKLCLAEAEILLAEWRRFKTAELGRPVSL
jgi:hypothetical protein